ncbi:MAG: glycosyl hydrolase family protein [Gemmatimonadetes bacterium]|nr:glycosyl hydrolase family protein [Gemmatimonadota bacterium]
MTTPEIVVSRVGAWRGYAVEWHEGMSVLLSRRNRLYSADGIGGTPTLIGEVPLSLGTRLASSPRLGQRLLRTMFYNVVSLGDARWLVTFGNRIGILSPAGWTEIVLPRPSRVLRGGIAVSPSGTVWFGEYWDNVDRGPMSIYRWDAGATRAEVAHVFERGSIYHVHGVSWDPYRRAMVCLTGDRTGECRMLLTRDEFATFEVIGAGSEDWRAVSVVSVPDGWLYGTDAEFETNVIAHVDAKTGYRTVLKHVEGPVYYSRRWGPDGVFGVTAERCAIMPHPEAVLLLVEAGGVRPLVRFEKDLGRSRLAWRLFMPGTLNFAGGPGHDQYCFVSGVALRGLDAQVLVLSRS